MANGIQALDRGRQVIAMCGDGGFTMLMQEFMTAVQYDLPLKGIVFNNSGWGLVRLETERAGQPAFEGVDFRNPDFAKFAEACGGSGFTITDPANLESTLQKALEMPGPVVVDVNVDAAELPSLPHIDPKTVWKFGIGRARELLPR
jgi:pyruvate dehydrogenase (quinone)